ncbi:MAG TPA: membrane protein insertion efficiency factor YidD [Burkholderiales bacterium]|nr:membrane protein insertion efficiency factor YidD [Burkholderiales bacterium]
MQNASLRTVLIKLCVVLIRAYQLSLSPFLPAACRFHPTCSTYASEALTKYGFIRGFGLAIRRLAKCHPWHSGGIDPVP